MQLRELTTPSDAALAKRMTTRAGRSLMVQFEDAV